LNQTSLFAQPAGDTRWALENELTEPDAVALLTLYMGTSLMHTVHGPTSTDTAAHRENVHELHVRFTTGDGGNSPYTCVSCGDYMRVEISSDIANRRQSNKAFDEQDPRRPNLALPLIAVVRLLFHSASSAASRARYRNSSRTRTTFIQRPPDFPGGLYK